MHAHPVRVLFVGHLEAELAAALREQGVTAQASDPGFRGIVGELRRGRHQLLHAREAHWRAALIGRAVNVPVVVEASAPTAAASRASRLSARTLCGGAALRDSLLSHGAIPSHTMVLRGLLDPSLPFRELPLSARAGTRWVVCAAPLEDHDRGLPDVLLAFLSVVRSRPDAKLLLAGPGSGARALALVEAAGLRGCAEWAPASLGQLPELFAGAAAVVAPARLPAFADAVPEAMAAGAPVVATAITPHLAWVREGRTGFLVPPRAPASLAARLSLLLDDPALATRMGDEARLAAVQACRPRALAHDLARSYVDLLHPLSRLAVPLLSDTRRPA
jgi:hypothetical protein